MVITEEQFEKAFRHGDKESFDLIFNRYYPQFVNYAKAFLNNLHDAEDIVADIFMKLLSSGKCFRDEQHFKGYMTEATKHTCLNLMGATEFHRKILRLLRRRTPVAGNKTEWIEWRIDISRIMYSLIGKLSPGEEKIFKMAVIEQMRPNEIAASLGISRSAVDAQLKRAAEKLKSGSLGNLLRDYLNSHEGD